MGKCTHPESERTDYHDMSVVCNACNCVIEQYGKELAEPSPLGPTFPSSASPAGSTAEAERAEFEGFILNNRLDGPEMGSITRDPLTGSYIDTRIQVGWVCWQGARQ